MKTLEEIEKELLSEEQIIKTLEECEEEDLIFLHWSLGTYIRNKYLWHQEETFRALSKHFNGADEDEVSFEIIKDLYYITNKKRKNNIYSSKPNK